MRKNLNLVFALFLVVLGCCRCDPAAAVAPLAYLYTEESVSGEDLDTFALRIAPQARAWTQANNAELCGSFQQRGEAYRIAFHTTGSVNSCDIEFGSAGDWKATRMTMHTHTAHGGSAFSVNDTAAKLQGFVVSSHFMVKRWGNREKTFRLP